MKCPICFSLKTELIDIQHAFFRHIDLAAVKQAGCLGRCPNCQSLFNVVGQNDIAEIDNLLKSREYSLSRQTSQTLLVKEYKEPVTRSFLQAELLCKLLNKENPAILDVGCFDGELLVALNRLFKSADLHGFDVNGHIGLVFPKKDKFHFWSSDLKHVQGKFDTICMSHTIMYVKDITYLMEQIKRLIKPEGLLFIQVPDISINPCYILMGDQYYYYTVNTLKNVLQHFGFEFSPLETKWFPREIAGIARLISGDGHVGYIEDSQIYQCVEYLNSMVTKLNKISNNSRIGVLGTAVNAAFVDSVLGEKVVFFADENDNRVGSKFRNKEVLHPQSLDHSDLLIIPYGRSSQQIKERFQNEYKGRFVSLSG